MKRSCVPLPGLVELVAHRDPESEAAPVDLGELDGDRHRHAHRGGRQMGDVDARPDGGLAGREAGLDRLDRRLLDEPDHVRRGEDADRLVTQVRRRHVVGHRHRA